MNKNKFAFLLVVMLTMTGCSLSSDTSPATQPATQVARETLRTPFDCGAATNDQNAGDRTASRNPIRIAIFQDKSGSSNETRTTQLSENDFAAPIDLLRCTGGELGAGIIDDVSNKSLIRLRIEVPPARPAAQQVSNVFERAQQDGEFAKRMEAYNDDVAKWTAETDKRVKAFLAEVRELLNQKPTARKTDVWSAISRADLFLNESDATWRRPTHRWLVLNSDAVDTARSKPIQMKAAEHLVIVNGVGSAGAAASIKPDLFENPEAAFHFITANELGGK